MKPHPRLKVGVFVVVSFFGLLGGILWLAGSRFMRPVDSYNIIFDKSVSGLLPGARVEYQGVTVGKVKTLRLTREAPPRVDVTVDLRPGTPVRRDTHATLIGSLITNIRFVQLSGGSQGSPMLEDGGVIPADSSGFDEIQDQATVIAGKLEGVLDQIQKEVLTPQNIVAVGTLIRDLSQTSTELHQVMAALATPQSQAALRSLLLNADRAVVGVRRATDTINGMGGDVTTTLTGLQQTVKKSERLLGETNLLVSHLDLMVAQNQDQLGRLLGNLADASLQLGQASMLIRDDPSRLIWGNNLPYKEIPDK